MLSLAAATPEWIVMDVPSGLGRLAFGPSR
jgi:hypothetical protein